MRSYAKPDDREPFKLPIAFVPDQRSAVCRHYANKMWRHNDIKVIAAMLENLYEQAYSAGLRDMDKMHGELNEQ